MILEFVVYTGILLYMYFFYGTLHVSHESLGTVVVQQVII